ncbi:MAG: type II toxin-antitoxin system RelE family toxin [Anaerolineae bacterium]
MYKVRISDQAARKLSGLPKEIASDVARKIYWLAANAEEAKHERLKGHRIYSLHCGQYRVLYVLNRSEETLIIEDIDKHDLAYRKLKR